MMRATAATCFQFPVLLALDSDPWQSQSLSQPSSGPNQPTSTYVLGEEVNFVDYKTLPETHVRRSERCQ